MIKTKMSEIINLMNKNDDYCQGASQQMANGFYRIFDALEYLAHDMDENNSRRSEINALSTLLEKNNSYCQGAPQQCANGAYRIVELLQIIISMLDKEKKYSSETSAIISLMNKNNSYCQGAPQQTANGSYRIVEMLEVLAKIITPAKSSSIATCISAMNRTNNLCQGAPQQSANGTDAAFIIVQYMVSELDKEKKYGSRLSALESLKSRNNARCQGADQQSANNIYRIMETIQILGDIIHDEEDKKIQAYWAEHSEEHSRLIGEISENRKAIKEIEKKADAVNADDEIETVRADINRLSAKRDDTGKLELASLNSAVEACKKELAEIGFFKFALRKEAKLKLDGAQANYNAKEKEINAEKAKIQKEIDVLADRIKSIKARVDAEKKKILADCAPYRNRIDAINTELTKKR